MAAVAPSSLRLLGCTLALLMAIAPTGCVRRRMTIRTNPVGAKVYVDEQEIGTTPVSTNYTYYADRKITIVKDGYRTETVYQRFSPPWYEIPPLDFVTENLWPTEIRDERSLDFQLVPQENVQPEELLGRAENLRGNAKQGTITPLLPNQPTPQPNFNPTGPTIGLPGEGLPENAPLPYPQQQTLPPPVNGQSSARLTEPIPVISSSVNSGPGPGLLR